MALEPIIDSIDGVDDQYKDLYIKNTEGKFEINISGLKTALNNERVARKKLEKQLNSTASPDDDVVTLQTKLTEANNMIKGIKLDTQLKKAAITAGVDPDYVDDVISLTKGNFDLSEDGDVMVINNKGEAINKSVESFFKSDFKKTKPRYYITTGRTGGGMLPNSSGGVNEPLSGRGKLDKAIQEKDLNTLIHLKHNKK
jgi:hypothetical protein